MDWNNCPVTGNNHQVVLTKETFKESLLTLYYEVVRCLACGQVLRKTYKGKTGFYSLMDI